MSDNFTHFGTIFSTFLLYYVITPVTTRSAGAVRMTHTTNFIKAISATAGISCSELWIADPRGSLI